MTLDPYPLILNPILKEKVWGGRRLAGFGKDLPAGARIGESWELADLASTSPTGGGGGEARSVILNGPCAGDTLHEVMQRWRRNLLGDVPPSESGGFPLLVKYLDAQEHLSVQVHPTAEYVDAHPEAFLKTESWFILEAAPGSAVFKGVRPGTTLEELTAVVSAGGSPVHLLTRTPVTAGELHHLPSGTVHALGAGVLAAEIQTPSDTTFRFYDWAEEYGRSDRLLHPAEALANAGLEPPPPATRLAPGSHRGRLVETDHYTIELLLLDSGYKEASLSAGCHVLMVESGPVGFTYPGGDGVLESGVTCVIPAAVAAGTRLSAPGPASLLLVRLETK